MSSASLPECLCFWEDGGHVWTAIFTVPLFPTGCPLPVCARPVPSIHHSHHPWGGLIRGNSHNNFSVFAVVVARHSQCLFRVVQLPHWVKSFWGLLTPWALLLPSMGRGGTSSFLLASQLHCGVWEHGHGCDSGSGGTASVVAAAAGRGCGIEGGHFERVA